MSFITPISSVRDVEGERYGEVEESSIRISDEIRFRKSML